ncbi:O-Glycosyl hydrolase family 30 [Mucilaginibacter sp. NFR10]|nr:O-Glycosyl hydrolase family 30 [Mucilaginibacter sp. NFR10]
MSIYQLVLLSKITDQLSIKEKFMRKNQILSAIAVTLACAVLSCRKNAVPPAQQRVNQPVINSVQSGGSITVGIGSPLQKIDLIGAGCYFYSGHLVNGITNFTDASNWLWHDLNVNVFKIVLRADGVEDVNDNTDPNNTDFSKFNFTGNSNLVDQITALKKAQLTNPAIKVWAIVLSPPKYLKTNNSVNNGGTLNASVTNAYSEFGEFLYAHIKNLKDNGITVNYLSLMNEPDYPSSGIAYESAEFTTAQAQSVYTSTAGWLKTKLQSLSISAPVFASPDCIDVTHTGSYVSGLNASGNVSLFTTHQYLNSSAANFSAASSSAGAKGLYMTEWHAGFGMGTTPDELTAALDLVNKFHDAFRGGAKGWLYFEWGNPETNFGGLLYTPWGAPAVRKKNYYVFQQYTANLLNENYIPTTLTGITNFGADNVSAFTTSNKADINVVNWNTDPQNRVRLYFGGNISTIRIYRTSATENNALIWSQDNVNQNYYDVDYAGKSFTTVRVTW